QPLDTLQAPALPISLEEAVRLALHEGPRFRIARANERAASALLAGTRGTYLPELTLSGENEQFDTHFFPEAQNLSLVTFRVSLPIWTGGAREIAISEARVNRDVARAAREDVERAALGVPPLQSGGSRIRASCSAGPISAARRGVASRCTYTLLAKSPDHPS